MASNTDERVLRLVQRIEADRAGAQQAISAVQQLKAQEAALEQQQKRMDAQYARSVSAMLDQVKVTDQNRAQIDQLRATLAQYISTEDMAARSSQSFVEGLRAEAQAAETARTNLTVYREAKERAAQAALAALPEPTLDEALGNFQTTGGGRDGQRQRGALGNIAQQLILLPDVGPTTEVARVLNLVDAAMLSTGASGLQLAAGFGVLGVGIGAVALIAKQASDEFQRQKAAQQAVFEGQRTYFQIIQEGTTETIRLARDAAQVELDNERRRREDAQAIVDQANALADNVNPLTAGVALLARFGDDLGLVNGHVKAAEEQLASSDQTIMRLEADVQAYNNALNSTEVAANDAAEALRRQAEANLKFAEQSASQQLELLRLTRNSTPEQVRDQIQAYQDQIEVTTSENVRLAQLSAHALIAGNTEVYDTYQQQIADNLLAIEDWRYSNEQLRDSILPIVEAQERQKQLVQGLTDQNEQYLKSLEQDVAARQAIFEATKSLAEETEQNLKNLADIEQEARDARFEALQESEAQRQEEEQKAAEQEIKALRDHNRRVQEINDKANLTIREAEARRDVAAAKLAERQRQEELKKENTSYQDRLLTIDENLQKQYAKIDASYDKQLAKIDDAARKAQDKEAERHRKEAAIRQHAYDEAEVQLRNAMNAQTLTYQTMSQLAQQSGATTRAQWVNIAQTVASGLEFVRQGFSNTLMQIARDVQAGARVGGPDVGFQYGTGAGNLLGSNGLLYAPATPSAAPTGTRSAPQTASAPAFNIYGATPASLEQKVLSTLRKVYR